jgi:hypothetical protein
MSTAATALGSTLTRPVPARERRVPDIVNSLCLAAAILLLVLPAGWFQTMPRALVVWLTFLVLVVIVLHGYLHCIRRGMNPWLSPMFVLPALFCHRFGWGSVVGNYWHDFNWVAFPELRMSFHRFGAWANLPNACYLVLLFGLGMYIGLRLGTSVRRPLLPGPRWDFSEAKLKRALVFYAPVALGVNSLLQFSLPLSIKFAVGLLGQIIYPVIAIVSYWACSATTVSDRVKWSAVLIVLCLGSVPVGLQTGQIVGLLLPGLMAILGYTIARNRLPWKALTIAVPLLVLLVIPYSHIYKQSRVWDLPITQRLWESVVRYDMIGWRARLELSMERLLLRFAGANMPAVYSRYYPAVFPFEHGRTFAIELRGLVPRVIWPDKGYGSYELNRYPAKVGMVQLDGNTTALFDAVSEYYLNFGILGMFLLSVVHGYYFGVLSTWLQAAGNGLIGAAMFVTLIVTNEDFYGIGLLFLAHVKALPVWLLMFYFFSRRNRRRLHA